MIDLDWMRRWGTTVAMLVFLLLWQLAERKERIALKIADDTVQANRGCVASYAASAAQMNAAVDALTLHLRTGE